MKFNVDFTRSRIRDILEYVIAFMLMVDCRTIWQRLRNTPGWFNILVWIVLIGSTIGCIFLKKKFSRRILDASIIIGSFLLVYLLAFLGMRSNSASNYFKFAAAVVAIYFFIFLYCDKDNFLEVMRKYEHIVLLFAGISLFFWIFGSNLGIVPELGTAYTTWGAVFSHYVPNYYYIFFTTQKADFFGMTLFRNTSIFTEAPMASFHFSLALLTEVLLTPKVNRKKWKIYLLAVTMLTTLSLTGCAVLFLLLVLRYIFNEKSQSTLAKVVKYILLPAVGAIGMAFAALLLSFRAGTESGIGRLRDFTDGFKVWMTEPIFGYGYKSELVEDVGFSNSIIPVLTQCGLYLFLFYIVMFVIGFYKTIKAKNKNTLIFAIIFLFVFCVTNIPFQYLTIFVLMGIIRLADYKINYAKELLKWIRRSR